MSQPVSVLVDTYGGSEGPDTLLAAAARLSVTRGPNIVLLGHGETMRTKLAQLAYDPMRLRLVDAGLSYANVTGDRLASDAVARRALPQAVELVASGEADALVSTTAAELVMQAATAGLSRADTRLHVAEAAVFPTMPRPGHDDPLALLVDVSGRGGDDADALCSYALMGAAYARVVTGIREPHVGLLSTGLQARDGPDAVVQAHERLRRATGFRFVGNLRATDLPRGMADVVVVDGFVGHTVRGLLESVADMTVEAARYAWRRKVTWRVAMRMLSEGVGLLRKVNEFKEYGGAPLLGLRAPVIVADHASSEQAVSNAIKLAAKCVRGELNGEIDRMATEWPDRQAGVTDQDR